MEKNCETLQLWCKWCTGPPARWGITSTVAEIKSGSLPTIIGREPRSKLNLGLYKRFQWDVDFIASLMMPRLKMTLTKREAKDAERVFQKCLSPIFKSDRNWVLVADLWLRIASRDLAYSQSIYSWKPNLGIFWKQINSDTMIFKRTNWNGAWLELILIHTFYSTL